ncbi:molybdenum cofactor guanylyltransferase [Candidatus Bathyarchaeota archaeon]|nr:MAG: molybdenum cofactor guanylyltransferase [Candidatus Bathyarchaeota archaeon]
MKKRTGIILAGGAAERLGYDKGLIELNEKPLVLHVFDRIKDLVDEVIVVVSSAEQKKRYKEILPPEIIIHVDVKREKCPLIGALTGFAHANGTYSALLPCDTPFISKDVIELLFEASFKVDAVIPRWPNGYIEPLQAIYHTSSALSAAKEAVMEGRYRMQSMISLLRSVRYFSTIVLREFDSDLLTFFNVNRLIDLKRAERIIKFRDSSV